MSPAQKRKREKVGRYDPMLMQTLRAKMKEHPNPLFGRMLAEGRMSDSDVLDFSLNVAHAYFSGDLLEPVAKAAGRELERLTRRTLLVTAALFGMTAIFDEDGSGATLVDAWSDDDPNVHVAAVQALVDVGMSVKDAMAEFASGPPKQGFVEAPMHAQMPTTEVRH